MMDGVQPSLSEENPDQPVLSKSLDHPLVASVEKDWTTLLVPPGHDCEKYFKLSKLVNVKIFKFSKIQTIRHCKDTSAGIWPQW